MTGNAQDVVMRAGESWASRHPEIYRYKPKRKAEASASFWTRMEAIITEADASRSPFVKAVDAGTATRECLREFACDLVFLTKEYPLAEGLIASKATMHGVGTVTMLNYGQAVAFGYDGSPYLPHVALDFAAAWGVTPEECHGKQPSRATSIFLLSLSSLGLEAVEAGIAATMVSAQWAPIARVLRNAFTSHYGLSAAQVRCFDSLERYDGPRTENRPLLLQDIAQSGYHQFLVEHGVRQGTQLWRHMWDSWLKV